MLSLLPLDSLDKSKPARYELQPASMDKDILSSYRDTTSLWKHARTSRVLQYSTNFLL